MGAARCCEEIFARLRIFVYSAQDKNPLAPSPALHIRGLVRILGVGIWAHWGSDSTASHKLISERYWMIKEGNEERFCNPFFLDGAHKDFLNKNFISKEISLTARMGFRYTGINLGKGE